jgi:hypothetical protein
MEARGIYSKVWNVKAWNKVWNKVWSKAATKPAICSPVSPAAASGRRSPPEPLRS